MKETTMSGRDYRKQQREEAERLTLRLPRKLIVPAVLSCYPDRGGTGTVNLKFGRAVADVVIRPNGCRFEPTARQSSHVLFALERVWRFDDANAVPLQERDGCLEIYSAHRPVVQETVRDLGKHCSSTYVTIKDGLLLVHSPGFRPREGDET